jgi:hypothetical protein
MLRKRIVLMLFNLKLKKNKSQEGSLVHPHSTLRYSITETRLNNLLLASTPFQVQVCLGFLRYTSWHPQSERCEEDRAINRMDKYSIPGSKFGYHVGGGNKFPVRHQLNPRGKETPRLILEQISTGYRHNQKQFPGWMDGCPV